MNVTECLRATEAWLLEHGVTADELPAPASPDALKALVEAGSAVATADLLDLYGQQDGFPHWFVLYDTWQFLTLEEAFRWRDLLQVPPAPSGGQSGWQPHWLPVLTNTGGDYCFVDLHRGGLDFYSHLDGEHLRVSASMGEFLNSLVRDLQQGRYLFEDGEPRYAGVDRIG